MNETTNSSTRADGAKRMQEAEEEEGNSLDDGRHEAFKLIKTNAQMLLALGHIHKRASLGSRWTAGISVFCGEETKGNFESP